MLATFDQQEWGKRVGDTLPGATVSIAWTCVSASCVPNTDPPSRVFGTYVVTLGWTDRRTNVTYDASLTGTTEGFQYVMTSVGTPVAATASTERNTSASRMPPVSAWCTASWFAPHWP